MASWALLVVIGVCAAVAVSGAPTGDDENLVRDLLRLLKKAEAGNSHAARYIPAQGSGYVSATATSLEIALQKDTDDTDSDVIKIEYRQGTSGSWTTVKTGTWSAYGGSSPSVTISGLTASTSYQVRESKNGTPRSTATLTTASSRMKTETKYFVQVD